MNIRHFMYSLRKGGYCAASAAVLLLAQNAWALGPGTPGSAEPSRVEDQIQKHDLNGPVSNDVSIPEVRIEGAPAGAEHIRFTLKSIKIEGNNIYSENELAPIYQDQIGKTISLTDLYGIAGAITKKYRNDGYIISQTVVPQQTIAGGDAKLLVVEGSLDQIVVDDPDGGKMPYATAHIQALADKLHATDHPLRSSDIERYLLLINDIPGVSARSIIGPSTTQTGKADMRIIVTRDPANFLLGVDNYGSAFLGPDQLTAAAQINNIFNQDDRLLAEAVLAPYDDEMQYWYGAYERPLGSEGATLTADISYTDTEPGFTLREFGAEGFSTTIGATVRYPLIRSRNQNLTLRARLETKTSSTKNDLGITTDDDTRSVRLGAHYELLSTAFGTSVNMADFQVSKGLGIFGASDKGDSDLSRADGDPEYTKFELEMTRLQRIVQDFNVLVGFKGQKASEALLAQEEFGLGGMSYGYGRGYDPSEILGDDGIAGKVELQWNAHMFDEHITSLQFFTFYDVGEVWNKDATTSADKRDSIASAGLGARARLTPSVNADITWAKPLTRDVATNADTNSRWFASLTTRF